MKKRILCYLLVGSMVLPSTVMALPAEALETETAEVMYEAAEEEDAEILLQEEQAESLLSEEQGEILSSEAEKVKMENLTEVGESTGMVGEVQAAEVQAEEVQAEAAQAENVQAADVPEIHGEMTYVNPLYPDVIVPEELEAVEAVVEPTEITYYTSIASAGECLRQQMKNRSAQVQFGYKFSAYDTSDATTTAIMEGIMEYATQHTGNPTEGDYLAWQYDQYHAKMEGHSDGSWAYVTITYTIDYYTSLAQERAVDAKINEVLSELNLWNASPYEKVRGIYRYICDHTTYDYANKNNTSYKLKQTAYAALMQGTSVCQGYAVLFYRMALELGVPCRVINGYGSSEAHGWNAVQIGAYWYNLDTTWDAGKLENNWKYFLKCDANFGSHVRASQYALADTEVFNLTMAPFDYSLSQTEINQRNKVKDFVTRLYKVCLDRNPDTAGLEDWSHRLITKQISGVEAAYGFIFSNEFKKKNLCNSDYVEYLYKAFMGRGSDSAGKKDWVGRLNSGKTREEVFNGFALSQEFGKICANAGISQGSGISIPKYGTVPTGKCKICGTEDGVTSFVKRLYKICLNRTADASGLKDWTTKLWNHTESGSSVAYGFIFSKEFIAKNYSNSQYIERLYQAFMGRGSDAAGKADWLARMNRGWTRKQVFDGFVGSQEFTKICQSYGISRD